jgi:site-specific DNA recombinase
VWQDVCELLRQPQRIEAEYERRLQGQADVSPTSQSVAARIAQVKRGIARLIDGYQEGLLNKSEFEPRLRQSKERLARLQTEGVGPRRSAAGGAALAHRSVGAIYPALAGGSGERGLVHAPGNHPRLGEAD